MAKIPPTVIDSILDKTDFISIFQGKVRLQKKGGRWWGLCPFHSEKTPSFSVDGEHGLFYCFGCHKGGSIIDFLMETEKLSFTEAVSELAEKAGVKIETGYDAFSPQENEKNDLFALNEKLSGTFSWFLHEHASGKHALEVLLKRGLPLSIIKDFRLGYAPSDKNWLFGFLRSKGYSAEFLAKAGLFSSTNKTYPLFANRIIFPIIDQRGRVLGFGGRLLEGDGPKYINSPDTAIFHKQENLYAIDKALETIKTENRALICEGYMDAISFHAAGVTYAVAPLGTAFTSRQASLLRRRAEKVLLCFDSDEAGQKATERASPIAVSAGLEADVLQIKGGKDASEILEKYGGDALKKVIEYSINSGNFLIERASRLFDMNTVDGKAKAIAFLYPYIDALGSEVKRETYVGGISRLIGVNASSVITDYNKARSVAGRGRGGIGAENNDVAFVENVHGARTADLIFMSAAVMSPALFPSIRTSIKVDDLDDTRAQDLYSALDEAFTQGISDPSSILSFCVDEAARMFVLSIVGSGELDLENAKIIEDGIRSVRLRSLERARTRLISELARMSSHSEEHIASGNSTSIYQSDESNIKELLERKMRLDQELNKIKGEVDE
jgi:DNA primase